MKILTPHSFKFLNSTELQRLRFCTEERCRLTWRDYFVLLVRANACLSTPGCAQMCLLPPDIGKLLTGFVGSQPQNITLVAQLCIAHKLGYQPILSSREQDEYPRSTSGSPRKNNIPAVYVHHNRPACNLNYLFTAVNNTKAVFGMSVVCCFLVYCNWKTMWEVLSIGRRFSYVLSGLFKPVMFVLVACLNYEKEHGGKVQTRLYMKKHRFIFVCELMSSIGWDQRTV